MESSEQSQINNSKQSEKQMKKSLDDLTEAEVTKRQNINIQLLSWGCCFVVCGLKLVGSFSTPLLGDLGATSLSLLYYGGAIAFIVGPSIMNMLPSAEFGMKIIGPEYAIYILSFVYYIPWFCLTWSAIHGVAASIFWTCQIMILKANSTIENVGRKSSLFWAIYMGGSIVGNLIAYYVLNVMGSEVETGQTGWLGSVSIMFSIFVVFSLVGSIFFYFYRPIPDRYRPPSAPKSSFLKRLKLVGLSFTKPRVLCMLPIAAAWGFELPFINSMFNRQIHDRSIIGLITAYISFIEVIFSFVTGPVMDFLGIHYAMLMTTFSFLIGIAISYFACEQQNWLLYFASTFFAIADTGYQTIMPVLITHYKDETIVNASIRFTANVIGGLCYNIAPLFINEGEKYSTSEQYLWELIITSIIIVLSQIFYWIYCYAYPVPETVEYERKKKEMEEKRVEADKQEIEMVEVKKMDESKDTVPVSSSNETEEKKAETTPNNKANDSMTVTPVEGVLQGVQEPNAMSTSSKE